MPELPEVETVKRSLEPHLPGREVLSVVTRSCRIFRQQSTDILQSELRGQRFHSLSRHGKWLFLSLGTGVLCVHLGMTGQLTVRLPSREDTPFLRHLKTGLERTLQHPPDQHTHFQLGLSDGASLLYRDVRKFGRIQWFAGLPPEEAPERFSLGVDPLSSQFTESYLFDGLKARKRALKAVLLDQQFLAGLGNIYVDEALFLARLRPGRRANRVGKRECQLLREAIRLVLHKGIEAGGTTLRDFVNGQGEQGYNQEGLKIYGRYGHPCSDCSAPLHRGTYAGRTTTWCPKCQR